MKIAIMQPTFLPWIGYFKMIQSVDKFVFLDCVQFEKRSWQSRNKIKLNNQEFMLSLSLHRASQNTLIKDIKLSQEKKWKESLLKTLSHAYKKSSNFDFLYKLLEQHLYTKSSLSEFNIALIQSFCTYLGISSPILKASELHVNANFKKAELLLELCRLLKANEYLSPQGSKNYLEEDKAKKLFSQNNIKIEYFEYKHPIYKQFGKDFISHLGIIDYLACIPKNEWIHF